MPDLHHVCPHCGRVNDAADGPTPDATPKPGDVSICWGCGGLAFFETSGMRRPTAAELLDLDKDENVRAARAAIAESFTPGQASNLRWGGEH